MSEAGQRSAEGGYPDHHHTPLTRKASSESPMFPYRRMKCRFLKNILQSSVFHMFVFCLIFCILILTQPSPTARQYVNFREGKSTKIVKKHRHEKHGKHGGHSKHGGQDKVKDIKKSDLPAIKFPKTNAIQFSEYNSNNVVTFHNICIELDIVKDKRHTKQPYHKKKLVLYNSNSHKREIARNISDWNVYFKNESVPSSHHMITWHTAYFISTKDTEQFLNFWKNVYVGLYGIVEKTKRLDSTYFNYVYTKNNLVKLKMFKNMFFTINIHPPPATFHTIDKGTCYKNAVFGMLPDTSWKYPAKHLLRRLNITGNNCQIFTVTILQSSSVRRLLNADYISKMLRSMSSSIQVKVIEITKVTINKLLEVLTCTNVLITGQALGTAWLPFLKQNSTVIEVMMPRGKPSFQTLNQNHGLGVNVLTLDTNQSTIQVNWNLYSKSCKHGVQLDKTTKEKLLHMKSRTGSSCSDLSRFSDVVLKPDKLKEKLKPILPSSHLEKAHLPTGPKGKIKGAHKSHH